MVIKHQRILNNEPSNSHYVDKRSHLEVRQPMNSQPTETLQSPCSYCSNMEISLPEQNENIEPQNSDSEINENPIEDPSSNSEDPQPTDQ
jgi:hypothetical protein